MSYAPSASNLIAKQNKNPISVKKNVYSSENSFYKEKTELVPVLKSGREMAYLGFIRSMRSALNIAKKFLTKV